MTKMLAGAVMANAREAMLSYKKEYITKETALRLLSPLYGNWENPLPSELADEFHEAHEIMRRAHRYHLACRAVVLGKPIPNDQHPEPRLRM
jgi:hypothetical protein